MRTYLFLPKWVVFAISSFNLQSLPVYLIFLQFFKFQGTKLCFANILQSLTLTTSGRTVLQLKFLMRVTSSSCTIDKTITVFFKCFIATDMIASLISFRCSWNLSKADPIFSHACRVWKMDDGCKYIDFFFVWKNADFHMKNLIWILYKEN